MSTNTHLLVAFVAVIVVVAIIHRSLYNLTVLHVAPTTRSRRQCQQMNEKTKIPPTSKTLPWSSLLDRCNSTIRSSEILYVWPTIASTRRLGNRLFTYASTFGIAWHNQHVPIIPDTTEPFMKYDLAKFFNLRITTDKGNQVVKVSSVTNVEQLEKTQLLPVETDNNKITFKQIRSLSNGVCFKHDSDVCACAVSALIPVAVANLILEMNSSTSISYTT